MGDTENAPLFRGVQDEYEKQTEAPFTDSLTGLYNHGFFLELLERELKRFLRYARPLLPRLLDIDGLGRYNRRRGSIQGDRALKEVAAIIREGIRESDLAARYLGDTFAVLLLDTAIGDAEARCPQARGRHREALSGGAYGLHRMRLFRKGPRQG